jgi:hypothetical protein
MGAENAADFVAEEPIETGIDPENDPASELYLAVASMRAHSVRMKAVAEKTEAPAYEPEAEPIIPRTAAMPDYMRDDSFAASSRPEASPFHPGYARLDAAQEHLERGRLPDLNMLAQMMMEMKGAQRAYELNLQMIDATHAMMARTVDMLRR